MSDIASVDLARAIHHHVGIALRVCINQREKRPELSESALRNVTSDQHYLIGMYIVVNQLCDAIESAGIDPVAVMQEWRDKLSHVEVLPSE